MKKIKISLSLLTLSILLFGCLDYKEKMKLNPDLSGELSFNVGISEQLFNMGGKSGDMKEFDEDKLKENYSNKEGIRFISSRSYSESGNRWIEIKVGFDSIQALMKSTTDSTQRGMIGFISINENNKGEITFSRKIFGNKTNQDTIADELSKNMMEMMFGNYTWKYELTLPGKIISSNADSVNHANSTIYWSFPLSKISSEKLMTVTFRTEEPNTIIKYLAALIIIAAFSFFFIVLNKSIKRRHQIK